jgi:putative tryptophan/tyrosine transport system substrate-binding protein
VNRRNLITLLGGAAAWPLAARAQQPGKPARIAVFAGAENPVMAPAYRAFVNELRKSGFNEGENLVVDQRPTDQDLPALTAQAAEMVRANPDVLVALGAEPALQAFMQASRTIPVVFVANNCDPIAQGYVRSLANPGGNATGVFLRQTELAEKQVELLTQAFPDRTRMAVLWDDTSAAQFEAAERRAKLLRLEVQSLKMDHPPYDIEGAFRSMANAGANMLLILSGPFFARHRQQIVDLALRQRLPSMFKRGVDVLWRRPGRDVSPGWHVRRQDSQGREVGRTAGRTADEIRDGGQPQDREGDRRRTADNDPVARR